MKNLVLNTLALIDHMRLSAKKQQDYFPALAALGFSAVEVRREYICNFAEELPDIAQKAKDSGLGLFYSIPATLYKEKKLNMKQLIDFAVEAKLTGAKRIKMNIGDVDLPTAEDAESLKQYLAENEFVLSLENDQTVLSGSVEGLERCLKTFRNWALNSLDCTFDVGNWIYTGEDPVANAKRLKDYVGFIHLKDVQRGKPPKTVLLNEGEVDLQQILHILAKDLPLAIEYPCGEDWANTISKEIEKIEALLAQG